MAGIGKCVGIMTGVGMLGGAAASYWAQSRVNKIMVDSAASHAKDGFIAIGGRTKDGKMWDSKVTVDEYKKMLQKKSAVTSAINGVFTAAGTAIVAGLTLLLKSKLK